MEKESRDMKFDMLKIGDKVKFRGEKCIVVSFFTDELQYMNRTIKKIWKRMK